MVTKEEAKEQTKSKIKELLSNLEAEGGVTKDELYAYADRLQPMLDRMLKLGSDPEKVAGVRKKFLITAKAKLIREEGEVPPPPPEGEDVPPPPPKEPKPKKSKSADATEQRIDEILSGYAPDKPTTGLRWLNKKGKDERVPRSNLFYAASFKIADLKSQEPKKEVVYRALEKITFKIAEKFAEAEKASGA